MYIEKINIIVDNTRPIIARIFPLFFSFPVLNMPIKLKIIPKTEIIPGRIIDIIINMKTGTGRLMIIPDIKPIRINTLIIPNIKPAIANLL